MSNGHGPRAINFARVFIFNFLARSVLQNFTGSLVQNHLVAIQRNISAKAFENLAYVSRKVVKARFGTFCA